MTLNIFFWKQLCLWYDSTNQRQSVEHEEQDELQVTQRSLNQTLQEHNLMDTSSWSTEDQPVVKQQNIFVKYKAFYFSCEPIYVKIVYYPMNISALVEINRVDLLDILLQSPVIMMWWHLSCYLLSQSRKSFLAQFTPPDLEESRGGGGGDVCVSGEVTPGGDTAHHEYCHHSHPLSYDIGLRYD